MSLPEPYYSHGGIVIYHGDCRDILPHVTADVVVTDPPYGMNWPCDNRRFCGGSVESQARRPKNPRHYPPVVGDDQPFDPSPWMGFSGVVLWGANHYGQRLPVGTTLVWIKRLDPAFGSFLSDAEVAWMKGGHGVYCYRDLSMQGDTTTRTHPTQKPVPLMRWCIGLMPEGVILDPFMGSGTTLVAAKQLGRKAIGIEIEERYCEIAVKRLQQEVLPFVASEPEPVQANMLD